MLSLGNLESKVLSFLVSFMFLFCLFFELKCLRECLLHSLAAASNHSFQLFLNAKNDRVQHVLQIPYDHLLKFYILSS